LTAVYVVGCRGQDLLYYALIFFRPPTFNQIDLFYICCLSLTCIVSSWTTAPTIGVALIGVFCMVLLYPLKSPLGRLLSGAYIWTIKCRPIRDLQISAADGRQRIVRPYSAYLAFGGWVFFPPFPPKKKRGFFYYRGIRFLADSA